MSDRNSSIKVSDRDNVAIIVASRGLDGGAILEGGITLIEPIPFGQKVAVADIEKGSPIIRYGEKIGMAKTDIVKGARVKESLVELPSPPKLDELDRTLRSFPDREPLEGYTFEGYRNKDGTVGTKNLLGISTSVQCVAGVVDHAVERIEEELLRSYPNVDGIVGLNHTYGCGVAIDAPAAAVPIRTLKNLTLNPNFGGEIMVIGLGCEKLQPSLITRKGDERTSITRLQDEAFNGFQDMVGGILEQAEIHLQRLNRRQRETCPASDLVVGMQCGGSDAFSGITANPALGFATDLIVRAGGTVMFSEVTEVRDAIHLLVPRAADERVAEALIREMDWYDRYLATGQVDRSANPSPGNKMGGLSNVVEKALGSIAKSGSGQIADVLRPGERLRDKGLVFAATPASDFICGTLQLAAGMNIQVFTTGRGTPYGLEMAPVIKVSTNSHLSKRWSDLIDLDAGCIATGNARITEVGWKLFRMILEVASGREQVAADRLGLRNSLALFNPAPVT